MILDKFTNLAFKADKILLFTVIGVGKNNVFFYFVYLK